MDKFDLGYQPMGVCWARIPHIHYHIDLTSWLCTLHRIHNPKSKNVADGTYRSFLSPSLSPECQEPSCPTFPYLRKSTSFRRVTLTCQCTTLIWKGHLKGGHPFGKSWNRSPLEFKVLFHSTRGRQYWNHQILICKTCTIREKRKKKISKKKKYF